MALCCTVAMILTLRKRSVTELIIEGSVYCILQYWCCSNEYSFSGYRIQWSKYDKSTRFWPTWLIAFWFIHQWFEVLMIYFRFLFIIDAKRLMGLLIIKLLPLLIWISKAIAGSWEYSIHYDGWWAGRWFLIREVSSSSG